MEIVNIKNLSKVYGNGDSKVDALKNINLSVNVGEMIAIMGQSGSGKSTLLHLIGGLDKPTSGKVIVDGSDIYSSDKNWLAVFRRRKVGFIFQNYNLIPILSVMENITFPLLLDNKAIDTEYIDEIVELLGLKEKKNAFPQNLSGGQQQRAAIARALATKPAIILADEPTGNLDSKTTNDVISLLKLSIMKFHQTLIMITHNEKTVDICGRLIHLEDGNIKSDVLL